MSSSSSRAAKKYRPYFTLADLKFLHSCLVKNPDSNDKLLKYLDSFIYEIEKGYRTYSHITTPRLTLEDRLGIVSEEDLEAEMRKFAS